MSAASRTPLLWWAVGTHGVTAIAAVAATVFLGPIGRDSIAVTIGAALGVAVVLGWLCLRPVNALLRAVSDGLLSFRERDLGLKLAVDAGGPFGEIQDRFNALAEALRTEHNELYQHEILFSTVIEAAPLALLIHDEAQTVVLANGAARDLFSEGRRLEGQRFDQLLPTCPSEFCEAIKNSEDVIFSLDHRGETETFHLSKRYFEINTQQHTLLMLRPMTRELVRQEIEVWKKTIRVISHELNNSLAPISSLVHSARLIADKPEHTHRLGQVFSTIEERVGHLTEFLEGYARFARLPKPKKETVEWAPFLGRLRPLFPFALPAQIPSRRATFDPTQLEQVLINLLKNAVESGSPTEGIALEIVEEDGGFLLRVIDRGQGMTDEVLRKALLPFYTTKATGSGLGLPLAREIIEGHGGHLALQRREGGGIAVSLWLPAS